MLDSVRFYTCYCVFFLCFTCVNYNEGCWRQRTGRTTDLIILWGEAFPHLHQDHPVVVLTFKMAMLLHQTSFYGERSRDNSWKSFEASDKICLSFRSPAQGYSDQVILQARLLLANAPRWKSRWNQG